MEQAFDVTTKLLIFGQYGTIRLDLRPGRLENNR